MDNVNNTGLPPNKYIITKDGYMLIGRNWLHRDMLSDTAQIESGGWWYIDTEAMTALLYGRSEDFGAPTRERLIEVVLGGGDRRRLKMFDVYYSSEMYISDALNNNELIREKVKND